MNTYIVSIQKEHYQAAYLSTNCHVSSVTKKGEGFVQVSITGASVSTFGVSPDHLREFAANLIKVAEEVEAINAKIPA